MYDVCFTRVPFFMNYFSKLPLSPTSRGSSAAAAQSFSRNVPERSTFHSGQTRNRTRVPYAGVPTSSQDTSALNATRPANFFSKLSSKFSKRCDFTEPIATPIFESSKWPHINVGIIIARLIFQLNYARHIAHDFFFMYFFFLLDIF